ncbi:hypothetical protein MTO96_009786 [Rhipicephalus appendiculatus]
MATHVTLRGREKGRGDAGKQHEREMRRVYAAKGVKSALGEGQASAALSAGANSHSQRPRCQHEAHCILQPQERRQVRLGSILSATRYCWSENALFTSSMGGPVGLFAGREGDASLGAVCNVP